MKQVALIFAYDAEWITQIQPQGAGCSALWACFETYRALRRLGLNVDIIAPTAPLDGYALVAAPCLPNVPQELVRSLEQFDGQIFIGPRSGSKTDEFAIPDNLPPGPLAKFTAAKVTFSESLPPGVEHKGAHQGDGWAIARWLDHIEGDAQPDLIAEDGTIASYRKGRVYTLASWPQGALIERAMADCAKLAGLAITPMGEGARQRMTQNYRFHFDYLRGEVHWESTTPEGG